MILSPKIPRKLLRATETYASLIFTRQAELAVEYFETRGHLRHVPDSDAGWQPSPAGTLWGEPWGSAWFRASFEVPPELDGRALFVRAETDAIEAMFWVNGTPKGIFTHPRDGAKIGNHHTLLAEPRARGGQVLDFAVEAYAGHPCAGSQPFDDAKSQTRYPARYPKVFSSIGVFTRDEGVMGFVFDLRALVQLYEALPERSFRKGRLARVLAEVFPIIPQDPSNAGDFRPMLENARQVMAPALAVPAAPSAPVAGLVGHSHLDTAWMWTVEETARKAARTYSNALSLMEQYPEYTFVQSTPFHAELMRRHYPSVWDGIVRRVREGRWEPNGGMWIECDANMAGGEAMVRQFLKGIAFTRKHFGFTPDTFWLPDTFGYSASIPQILAGCGIRYFLTTKLTWNETNTFPYDTFLWEGLDGSRVLAHFNDIQCHPDPATLIDRLEGGGVKDFRTTENHVLHKDVNDRRLISYGMGDGGGGPQFESLEMARRCASLEGCPRAEHTSVSRFMRELESACPSPPVYHGELYFEGHRGTLTSIGRIKRGNRLAEAALRDAEILLVCTRSETPNRRARLAEGWDSLLLNQFHDILPGTSLPEVHDRAVSELESVGRAGGLLARETLGEPDTECALWNTLGWDRRGPVRIPDPGLVPETVWQQGKDIEGNAFLLFDAGVLPALGAASVKLAPGGPQPSSLSPFRHGGDLLESPDFSIRFDGDGCIRSLRTAAGDREICHPGGRLNQFFLGEDVPDSWDNWDIDEDQRLLMKPCGKLLRREVVGNGPLEFRLRSEWAIGRSSRITQDLVLVAGSPVVIFETLLDWHERHALLKVAFQTPLRPSAARHEIPFGHIERPVFRNNRFETVKFEVCNHRWTDLSESRHGVALLNDGKYGISVDGGEMRLSLAKGGLHPDPRGDAGLQKFSYAIRPHEGGFSAEAVIRPACELHSPIFAGGGAARASLFRISEPNIVCEAVKPAEDGNGYIIRLYEAERCGCRTMLHFGSPPAAVHRTNLLEEKTGDIKVCGTGVDLDFRAFEIVTLRVVPSKEQVL